ncbi:hypothetical protein [Streptomyces sp. B21-083]|uniref:hypothetical protein n=1 Tax=Streptomyces sp. B21-083 TaxID=3039410 RepID=UPI002FEE86FC
MATFNQANQTVGVQHNAENMIVGTPTSMADLAAGLNALLGASAADGATPASRGAG